jgi:hypothetical protein
MQASLRALLAGILDYAGLFPPAKLPLEQAIRNYARYRTEPESWLLGRFICPAAQLAELAPFHELFQDGPPFAFSALGRGGSTAAEFLDGLRADLEAIKAFRNRHGDRVMVDVLEVKLPAEFVRPEPGEAVYQFFTDAADVIEKAGGPALFEYFEPALTADWRASISAILPALSGGLKLRCGGLEASAFPTAEQVAFVLTACKNEGLLFKATAGLHHPVRRHDPCLNVMMHGFVNVFGAGVLAHAKDLDEEQVRGIVVEQDPASFVFDSDGFRWRDYRVSPEQIAAARHDAVISFGSCSFDEPRDDLRALGWLP